MKNNILISSHDTSSGDAEVVSSTQAAASDAVANAAAAVAKASYAVVSAAVASVVASCQAILHNAEESTRLASILSSINRALVSGMDAEHLHVYIEDAGKTAHAIADRAWIQVSLAKTRSQSAVAAAASASSANDAAVRSAMLATQNAKRQEESRRKSESAVAASAVEATSASQVKSLFIANMSHEIRTPLAVIKGFAELLASEQIGSEENQKWIMSVLIASQQLEILINDMLDISKIEAGKLDIEFADVSLRHMLSGLSSTFRDRAEKKGLQFQIGVEGQVPATIKTDKTRLEQILSNVIGNAIKFTEAGCIEITLKVLAGQLAFFVNDDGIGITPEQEKRLFQPFSQADSSITRKFGGTGLGLTLSRRLAQLLGGDIVLYRQNDKGSTFIVTIDPGLTEPCEMLSDLDELDNLVVLPTEPVLSIDAFEGFRILLVEDAPDIGAMLEHILASRGASVKWVENGLESIQMARRSTFDLILMDIQMPVLDGYEATRQLRLEGYTLPIYALTAHAMKGEYERCVAAGFTDYLTKPLSLKKLFATIRDYREKIWH